MIALSKRINAGICQRLFDIMTRKKLFDTLEGSKLIKLASSLSMIGCDQYAKRIFIKLLTSNESYLIIAEIIDTALECGFLDIALRGIEVLENRGYRYFELMYNKVLILYLIGENLKALDFLRNLIRKHGKKRRLMGLLSTIYISIGKFEEAGKILSMIRG